jgi:hypothetical protein
MRITPLLAQFLMITGTLGPSILFSGAVHAQVAHVGEGTRVRVQTAEQRRGDYWTGTVSSLTGDTIMVEIDGTDRHMAFPREWIADLRVSAGMGHAGRPGAGIGAFAGLVVGAIIGLATYEDTTCPAVTTPDDELWCDDTSPRLGRAAVGGLVGAGLGAGLGIVVGTRFPRERWESMSAGGLTARRGAARQTIVLGATIAF